MSSNTTKKYLVKPGPIISKSDGDEHWISFEQLVRLYGVNPDQCLNYGSIKMHKYPNGYTDNLITLEPRYDGNYSLEGES